MASYDSAQVLKLVLTSCIGAFLAGYQIGVLNPCQDNFAYLLGWSDSSKPVLLSVCNSLMPIGAVVGSCYAGKLCRSAGRRKALIISAWLMVFTCLLVIST
jgi:MFS family permease